MSVDSPTIRDSAVADLTAPITLNGQTFGTGSAVEMDYGFIVRDQNGIQYFVGKIDVGTGGDSLYEGSVITTGWNPVTQQWVGPLQPGATLTLLSDNDQFAPWFGQANSIADSDLDPYSNDVEIGVGVNGPTIISPGLTEVDTFSEIEALQLGSGNDSVTGGVGNEVVDGGAGNDTLSGGAGDDSLSGGAGNDLVAGGIGDDTVAGGAGNDTLTGGEGADSLVGGDGNDNLAGDAGSDTLAGGAGVDTLDGGDGDDDIAVGGADVATGGSGDDVFTVDPTDTSPNLNATITGGEAGEDLTDPANGGTGDTLDLSAATAPLTVNLNANPEAGTVNGLDGDGTPDITFTEIEKLLTGAGADTVAGAGATGPVNVDTGAGNDSIATGSGNDTIAAGAGDDTVDAGAGNDRVDAGAGDDSVVGGAGNDTLAGDAGDDTLDGGLGADSLAGGTGNDSLAGGEGNDTLSGGEGADTLAGGAGADSLVGGEGDDDLLVSAGDRAEGGTGDDEFRFDPTQTGNATITVIGGEGVEDLTDPTNGGTGDVLDLRGLTGVTVTPSGAASGTATYTNAANAPVTINFSEIERVLVDTNGVIDGTAAGDLMTPTSGAGGTPFADPQGDQIDGADGLNDTIAAGQGNDTVDAGQGDDTVDGGSGNDNLSGNVGNDSLIGGEGDDTLAGDVGADTLDGGEGADSLAGGDGADSLVGGEGRDTLLGGEGDDTLNGGAEADSLAGGAGNDTLLGGVGADTLQGGAGADSVAGEAGDDDIIVGGADTATGGTGDDVFTVDTSDPNLAAQVFGGSDGTDGAPDDAANGNAGDLLDLSSGTTAQTVNYDTNPENGTVNGLDSVAVDKLECDAPRPIDMDRVADWVVALKAVKIKARKVHVFGHGRRIKNIQPALDSLDHPSIDPRLARFPKRLKLFVPEALDHGDV
jgi:Ca2+-binding RTX toxin-like protein